MIDQLLGIVAPHHCCGCDKIGHVLCENCIFDIKNEPFARCIVCLSPTAEGLCQKHALPYSRGWCAGEREGVLEEAIDQYKFMRVRDTYRSLAQLLDETMPILPSNLIVTAVPSIATHIRQRGYDHTVLLAREFAARRGLTFDQVLRRRNTTVQRGASRSERLEQAKEAFALSGEVKKNAPYLIIDDVYTTGATVRYAAQMLRDAGASDVWIAVLTRQVSTEEA